MGHGRGKSCSSYELPPPPPPPVADYNVTGDLTPDATCNYFETGMAHGQPFYQRTAAPNWRLWYDGAVFWQITPGIDDYSSGWQKAGPAIVGDYNPIVGVIGVATVAAGPH